MITVSDPDLATLLVGYPPFDVLGASALRAAASAATVGTYRVEEVVLNAFHEPGTDVYLVISGTVQVWNDEDHLDGPADEKLGPGGIFGFSTMLTGRPVGPLARATSVATVARVPGPLVAAAFTSERGAAFLAESVLAAGRRSPVTAPDYATVDELIVSPPVIADGSTTAAAAAQLMDERHADYVAVRRQDGSWSVVTDSLLRSKIVAAGRPATTPLESIGEPASTARLGDSAAETLITMLDHDTGLVLVLDRTGELAGAVSHRDFAVSSTTSGVSLHEQLRRASTLTELETRGRRVPSVLADLLTRGLASTKVIAVYSALLDTIVRRAIALTLADRPDLSVDDFTWLSLGSAGRQEALPSSDVDCAVAFDDHVLGPDQQTYRVAFGEVAAVLARVGLNRDEHGATAERAAFSRTNAQWRQAARGWLAHPERNQGAIMTSLLVDGRPIHGDPTLPAASRVFGGLRRHPATMRLLLSESLARRARTGTFLGAVNRRSGTFDIKSHAVLPMVNLARWAALSADSAALPTVDRLRAAAGSAMLPEAQARTLVEVFEVLQRLRLRHQVLQLQDGNTPSDVVDLGEVSPIDRSVIAQAVREIAGAQRRMDNIAHYVPIESWTTPQTRP